MDLVVFRYGTLAWLAHNSRYGLNLSFMVMNA